MELFKILPNGKVEYDFNKFLTFDDVIIAVKNSRTYLG